MSLESHLPAQRIKIVYPSGAEVNSGNELTPLATKDQPTTVEYPAEAGALYTLALVNLDSPVDYKKEDRGIQNWLVVNIPGAAVEKGETIATYFGPVPRKDTGLARLLFAVFKQPSTLSLEKTATDNPQARLGFKLKEFAINNNLGHAVAANYFVVQYDDYAGEVRAKWNLSRN